MRPFRFLAEARAIATETDLAETARRAESIGIDVLVLPDHLIGQLAAIPAMATIAAATTRPRVAAFVMNNERRHPAVLAQDLASLDVLSEGRLEIAIGAGWNQPEYTAIGLPFDPTPVRQARLREAITVLKGCFANGAFLPGGADVGENPYRVVIDFEDVLDLGPQSAVVADVPVGRVDEIELNGWLATVTVLVNGDVELPANADAAIRQS